MRGADITQETLFTTVKLDDFVPGDHPLRAIRALTDPALKRMSGLFSTIYADTGRHSIAPEKLLRALPASCTTSRRLACEYHARACVMTQ